MLITEVINLPKMLPEIGKIKIGNKGETRKSKAGNDYRLPQKLDHFIITTNEKDSNDDFIIDSEIHAILGDQPKELPIRLLFNDLKLNFITRYAIYKGKDKCICEGDGVTFYWLNEANNEWKVGRVPVEEMKSDFKGDKCKINGVLSCVIEGVNKIGGVWKFRTVGINSVIALKTGLEFIQQLTGGQLAGIPLTLVLRPKTVNVEGKSTKVYVVNVEYRGTIEQLQETAYKILTSRSIFSQRLLQVEQQAVKQLQEMPNAFDEDIAETVAEFYPTQQEGYSEKTIEQDDLSALDDIKVPGSVENEEMPDLSGEEVMPDLDKSKDVIISKIAKMRTEAIAKVNEADTVEKLMTLKSGIGYKEDFGTYKKEADAVILDVIDLINDKIMKLTPPKHPETRSAHDTLKDMLISAGLEDDDLRNQFYKAYGDNEKYISDKVTFDNCVSEYKRRKIKGLISNAELFRNSIPNMLKDLNGKADEKHLEECMTEFAEIDTAIDEKNFKPLWALYKKLRDGAKK
jgi:hypothetical protein